MTEQQLIVLLLKIGLIAGTLANVLWVAVYTRFAKWWRNALGRTLVIESILVAGLFVPQIITLFFPMTAQGTEDAAWVDVALVGVVTPVMLWRTVIWIRLDKASQLGVNRHENEAHKEVRCGEPPPG